MNPVVGSHYATREQLVLYERTVVLTMPEGGMSVEAIGDDNFRCLPWTAFASSRNSPIFEDPRRKAERVIESDDSKGARNR